GKDTPTSANPVNPTAMLVKKAELTLLEARANVAPAPDAITDDYYARLPRISLTADPTGRRLHPDPSVEVILDSIDISRLVDCAAGHPSRDMRSVVAAAIWNQPEMFRQIFEFGLNAPPAFGEIRKIVAAALAGVAPAPAS